MIGSLEVIPKSIAPALIAYLALCYALGDVFASRFAERIHIPACIEGQLAAAAHDERTRDAPRRLALELLAALLKQSPGLSEIPGVGAIERLTGTLPQHDRASTIAARCSCLAAAARSETKFDYMTWVASIRFLQPAGVANFQGVMTRLDQSDVCGKGRL